MKKNLQSRIMVAVILLVASGISLGAAVIPVLAAGQDTFIEIEPQFAQQSRPQGGRPPREALEACADKQTGSTCSFNAREGNVTGTCQSPQSNVPAACVPEGMAPKS